MQDAIRGASRAPACRHPGPPAGRTRSPSTACWACSRRPTPSGTRATTRCRRRAARGRGLDARPRPCGKAFDAVPDQARIVLLGDKDQLAAVESGAVFSELSADPHPQRRVHCAPGETGGGLTPEVEPAAAGEGGRHSVTAWCGSPATSGSPRAPESAALRPASGTGTRRTCSRSCKRVSRPARRTWTGPTIPSPRSARHPSPCCTPGTPPHLEAAARPAWIRCHPRRARPRHRTRMEAPAPACGALRRLQPLSHSLRRARGSARGVAHHALLDRHIGKATERFWGAVASLARERRPAGDGAAQRLRAEALQRRCWDRLA